MKIFPKIRTRRVSCGFKELTVREMRELCAISDKRHEVMVSKLLSFVMVPDEGSQITDPLLMTVQERTRLLCHYIGVVHDDGADFRVGSDGLFTYSDFIEFDRDYASSMSEPIAGAVEGGEPLVCRHLLGVHAEMLERVCSSAADWRIGVMACQMAISGDPEPDLVGMTDMERGSWMDARFSAILSMPGSQSVELWDAYLQGSAALRHFFEVTHDERGIVFLGTNEGGRQCRARFHPDAGISRRAKDLFA